MVRLFKHYFPHAVLLLGLIDLAALLAAGQLSWRLRAAQIGTAGGTATDWLLAYTVVMFLALVAVGVYRSDALRSLRIAVTRLLVGLLLGILFLSLVDFVLAAETFWRSVLAYAVAGAFGALIFNRAIVGAVLGTQVFRRRIIVLGAGKRAQRLLDLSQRPESGFSVAAFIAMTGAEPVVPASVARADIPDLKSFVDGHRASEVVLAIEERRNSLPLDDLLRIKTTGVYVTDFASFLEQETGRVDLDTVNPSWLIFSDGFSSGRAISSVAKRAFDIVASALLLALAAPVIALFALLVKFDSRGPAFFRQTRVGLYGEAFDVIKLRSMRTDAEANGAQFAQENDPRVTRLGRFIRKVRIDELPQTWSVLKGEMSFVGPRPERPEFVTELEQQLPYYAERHMVKPGITGWAQINYPYGASLEDSRHKLEYDLYYAKNYTPLLDLLILLQTLRVVLWPEGAR